VRHVATTAIETSLNTCIVLFLIEILSRDRIGREVQLVARPGPVTDVQYPVPSRHDQRESVLSVSSR
jgi:hypothetical protein